MISKFKNKKTCKRLHKVQKGGSVSSAPKPNKTRTIKDFKKVVKTAKYVNNFTRFHSDYYLQKSIQNPGRKIKKNKKNPGRKFIREYIKHLKKQNPNVSGFGIIKTIKRINKYSSQKHDLSDSYNKLLHYFYKKKENPKVILNSKTVNTLHTTFAKKTNLNTFKKQVNSILHSQQP